MPVTRYLLLSATIMLIFSPPLKAQTLGHGKAQQLTQTQSPQQSPSQDPPQAQSETTLPFGGFQVQGSATMGYRFTNVDGFQPMYLTLFDLNSGPRPPACCEVLSILPHSARGVRLAPDRAVSSPLRQPHCPD